MDGIAGNPSSLFARTDDGYVFFKVSDKKWNQFLSPEKESIVVDAIASCNDCCVGLHKQNNSVYFFFPPGNQDDQVKVIHRNLQADFGMTVIDFFDGSGGSHAGFLGPNIEDTKPSATADPQSDT